MLIKDGKILRIRSDSGHYKPLDTNILSVLRALQMLGYRIYGITIEDYLGKTAVGAEYFISLNADWRKLQDSHHANQQLSRDLFLDRERFRIN